MSSVVANMHPLPPRCFSVYTHFLAQATSKSRCFYFIWIFFASNYPTLLTLTLALQTLPADTSSPPRLLPIPYMFELSRLDLNLCVSLVFLLCLLTQRRHCCASTTTFMLCAALAVVLCFCVVLCVVLYYIVCVCVCRRRLCVRFSMLSKLFYYLLDNPLSCRNTFTRGVRHM